MVDWLIWPADLLLSAGGIIASWFVSKDTATYMALKWGFQFWCFGCRMAICIFTIVDRIFAVASHVLDALPLVVSRLAFSH
jgi:hypothetical protein